MFDTYISVVLRLIVLSLPSSNTWVRCFRISFLKVFHEMPKSKPNILITGTPGVGKSTICDELIKVYDFKRLNIGDIVEDRRCTDGYDEELQADILDEDKLIGALEPYFNGNQRGGILADYHSCDLFPKCWFDRVFVLKTDNTVLYDRLTARGYNQRKLQENVECEIMNMIMEEAVEHYGEENVQSLVNDGNGDIKNNVKIILDWLNSWENEQSH